MTPKVLARAAGLAMIVAMAAPSNIVQAAKRRAQPAPVKPLAESSFADVIARYTFVGDFTIKPETRPTGEEVFWRYPISLPEVTFPIDHYLGPERRADRERDFPATLGEGRAVQHLNRGRALFIDGQDDEARKTWLSGRARYGQTYPFHRRNDYFIGTAFTNLAVRMVTEEKRGWQEEPVRAAFDNASTFLSWAFQVKRDLPDPLLEQFTPKGFYNLAAIYYRFGRYAASYGAATDGLNFLRKTGRKEYRPQLRRILAEAFIRNRSYLEAVQELDTALRQDVDPHQAAAIFARVGDIYFDLNNFELAEDAYALAARIDQELDQIHPTEFVTRGEALFWMGRYSDAQKMFHYALSSVGSRRVQEPLPTNFAATASLRTADAYLARREFEAAKLGYFKHVREFPSHETTPYAKIRLACLELPQYEGNNIAHARALLAEIKTTSLPEVAREMAWACEVASYAQHERTQAMVERVREFAAKYPTSRFLAGLTEPVREVQAERIEEYFKKKDWHGAVAFFEKTRKILFPKPNDELKQRLFVAYSEIFKPEGAAEFWRPVKTSSLSDRAAVRRATTLAELADAKGKVWAERNRDLARDLAKRKWTAKFDERYRGFINRIEATSTADLHLPWIFDLARTWADQDAMIACNLLYPILSRQWSSRTAPKSAVATQAVAFVDKYLSEVLTADQHCGYSVLEFEAEVLKERPRELASRYLTRTNIPINPVTGNLIWALSEQLYEAGDLDTSRQLWIYLRDNGPEDLTEVRYAKSRLDNRRSVLDNLWE